MSDSQRRFSVWGLGCAILAACNSSPPFQTQDDAIVTGAAGAVSVEPRAPRKGDSDPKPGMKKPSKPKRPDPVVRIPDASDADGGVDGHGGDESNTSAPIATAKDVAGTADGASCQSFTAADKGMCTGYYCGIDMQTLAAVIDPAAKCSNAEYFCSGDIFPIARACAKSVKDATPLAPDSTLRPQIETCVLKGELIEGSVKSDCIDCFLDAVDCGTKPETCAIACLDGSSVECDDCMKTNHCYDSVYSCAGLPSPF
jgi:hypothetical protein